jgi:hypothetical protein
MTNIDIYSILESKLHNSHYLKRYWKFIYNCTNDGKTYTERHHICPKASDLFPEYGDFKAFDWNSIELTARQHFIAHWMLWKAYGGSMSTAMLFMSKPDASGLRRLKSSKIYKSLRENLSITVSAYNKKYKTLPRENKHYICVKCKTVFIRLEFAHHKKRDIPLCSRSCSNSYIPRGNKGISKICPCAGWNKGKKCPYSADNGKKSAAKQSATVTGRKIVLKDGLRRWSYPGDLDYPIL